MKQKSETKAVAFVIFSGMEKIGGFLGFTPKIDCSGDTVRYGKITKRGKSKKKAIVAVARKLAELLYTLIKNDGIYEARKFKIAAKREACGLGARWIKFCEKRTKDDTEINFVNKLYVVSTERSEWRNLQRE